MSSNGNGSADIPSDDDPTTFKFTDDDGAPAALPETGAASEGSKVKILLGLLKKLIGVSDVANLRLSLPASLLEPMPNLEYWQYADRPDFFAAMGDSEDELERMLAVLRWNFSKDLKFVRAKIGKPYNSALGEHFRCHWTVPPAGVNPSTKEPVIRTHMYTGPKDGDEALPPAQAYGSIPTTPSTVATEPRDDVSIRSLGSSPRPDNAAGATLQATSSRSSGKGSKSTKSIFSGRGSKSSAGDGGASLEAAATSALASLNISKEKCEQVSHHPPVSSAYYACPAKGVEAVGVDQITAKVSGLTVQVAPGSMNKGMFVTLSKPSPGAGEEYHVTLPTAQINGIVKGNFYGTISDSISVTCRGGKKGKKLKAIVDYRDESWIGRPKFMLEGVIASFDPEADPYGNWTKVKHVPSDKVVAQLEGVWRKQIRYRLKGEKEWRVLIDMEALDLIPKDVRAIDEQEDMESRKLWDPVTANILAKNWGEATKQKQFIEQRQREKAAELKRKAIEHKPVYFLDDISDGKPQLSDAGRQAVQAELQRAEATS